MVLIFGLGGSALAVWLMKNFIDSIPRDLDEAAYLDGASQWRTFWNIIFPLVQPMLVAQFIFGFIGVYNEYILNSALLADPNKYPLGVGVRTLSTQYNTQWTLVLRRRRPRVDPDPDHLLPPPASPGRRIDQGRRQGVGIATIGSGAMPEIITPDWVKHAVFYQIFPDRFASSTRIEKPVESRTVGQRPDAVRVQGR